MTTTTGTETFLRGVLRVFGTSSLLAIVAVVMPFSWMEVGNRWLGLDVLPHAPIVSYLARSLSAFYALTGALLWKLSFDVRANRSTLCFLGGAIMVFGAMLCGIDCAADLPTWWKWWEGPFTMLIGAAIAWPAFRLRRSV